jgi:hypothetical protein
LIDCSVQLWRGYAPRAAEVPSCVAWPLGDFGGDAPPQLVCDLDIEENETTFTIDWKGRYRIEGTAFLYTDRETGRLATIHGYPTHKLTQMR